MDNDAERRRRTPPEEHGAPVDLTKPLRLPVRLVAPSAPKEHNVLALSSWVEVKVVVRSVDASGAAIEVPVKNERCLLFWPDGSVVESKTGDDGVVFFPGVPVLVDPPPRVEDVVKPAFVLPDVLEEWVNPKDAPAHFDKGEPPGSFGKNYGARDDYRKGDGAVRFVPVNEREVRVEIASLTPEEKFQHFRYGYEKNGAVWHSGSPARYDGKARRFERDQGAVCNQHINFFLSYWFNFTDDLGNHDSYEDAALGTSICTLCTYDSQSRAFGRTTHRSFAEFLEPVAPPVADSGVFQHARRMPPDAHYDAHYLRDVTYIRLSGRYVTRTGAPGSYQYAADDGWNALVAALADFNVYSLSNIESWVADKHAAVRDAMCAWAARHPTNGRLSVADAQALALGPDRKLHGPHRARVEQIMWDLDETDAVDLDLVHRLRDLVNWDHHGGIILKRGPGGSDPAGVDDEDLELWSFPADGMRGNSLPIILKSMLDRTAPAAHPLVLDGWFPHVAIWKVKPLRPGGLVPLELRQNAGGISIDRLPRFVHWAGDGASPQTTRKVR